MRNKQPCISGGRGIKPKNASYTARLVMLVFAAACFLRVFHAVDISVVLSTDGDVVISPKMRYEDGDQIEGVVTVKQTVKYAFTNFWQDFNNSNTYNTMTHGLANACQQHQCMLQAVNSPAEADLIVSSSALSEVDVSKFKAFKVLVTFENLGDDGRGPLRKFDISGFDYILGSHNQYIAHKRNVTSVRWPHYIAHACDGLQLGESPKAAARRCLGRLTGEQLRPLADRSKNATLVARNDAKHGAPATQFRKRILEEFARAGVQVDCPSRIGKNIPSIEQLYMSKVEFLSQYAFNICPEDSAGLGYVTEKLAEAAQSGAVPIYYGSLTDEDLQFFNKDRIIFIDPKNIAAAAEHVARLQRDRRMLNDLFTRPVLASSAARVATNIFHRLDQGLGAVVVAALNIVKGPDTVGLA